MKAKLQKDLKFLKPWWSRLIISLVVPYLIGLAFNSMGYEYKDIALMVIFIGIPTLFIILYFSYAWLYSDK